MADVTIYPPGNKLAGRMPKIPPRTSQKLMELFPRDWDAKRPRRGDILKSSFDVDKNIAIKPNYNGFAEAVLEAYNHSRHLKIRPDDVWLAILIQFSMYLNAHAEWRGSFLGDEGKKELKIKLSSHGNDFAAAMALMMEETVTATEVREWILPAFSTTTEEDKTAASIVMMATNQRHGELKDGTAKSGVPSVTLLGKKSDYENIFVRLERFRLQGGEPSRFANFLTAIVRYFVKSFDDPKDPKVLAFWYRVVSELNTSSGTPYYSGGISGFRYWDIDGQPLWDLKGLPSYGAEFRVQEPDSLTKDGAPIGDLMLSPIANAYCTVPLKVIINQKEYTTEMLAGSVATEFTSSEDDQSHPNTVQPKSGWWIYTEPRGGFN